MADSRFMPAEVVPPHTKSFDLGAEPWIPVRYLDASTASLVGLRQLFCDAHLIEDLAVSDPIERASLLRYLVALTMTVIADDPSRGEGLLGAESEFSSEMVERLAGRMQEHWWLFHPDTPFLQDPLLRTAKVVSKAPSSPADVSDPVVSAWSHIPSKSNAAFFNKSDATNDAASAVPVARAAFALLTRWYSASPGNESDVVVGSEPPKRRTEGGVLLVGPRSVTHVFRVSSTLARTLVANIPAQVRRSLDPAHRCAWELDAYSVDCLEDPLFLYTYAGSASFLVQPLTPAATVDLMVRGPVPRCREDLRKQFSQASRLHDPHALRILKSPGTAPAAVNDCTYLFWNTEMSQLRWIHTLYSRAVDASRIFTPLFTESSDDPFERKVFLSLETGGNATGVTIESAAWMPVDSSLFFIEPAERRVLVADLLNAFAGPSKSVLSTVDYHVRQAVAEHARRDQLAFVRNKAAAALWEDFADDLAAVVSEAASMPLDELARVDAKLMLQDHANVWVDRADSVYCDVAGLFAGSARAQMSFVENRNRLRGKLWNLLRG